MTSTTDTPIDLLACPRCDGPLCEASAAELECVPCRTTFPRLAGVPWLFAEPGAALGEWRGRWHSSLTRLRHEADRLAARLGDASLSATTRRRLEHMRAARAGQADRLAALLAPLDVETATAGRETYLALRTRPPADQGLTTYYANVHRDWHWGDAVNAASLVCLAAVADPASYGRTLVLGAGAGRLAYDLHATTAAPVTLALDFNPLLVLVADRLTRGETIAIYEFPLAPRSIDDTARLRELAAPAPAREGLHFVLGDAHRPPFAHGGFDTVVTPWLVDILPEHFATLGARINGLLAEGGRWINFGSLSFETPDPAERLSLEECLEALEAAGFAEPVVDEREIPYMCSPASRHGRRESVVSWSAPRHRAVATPPRHEALPDWLVRGQTPVPLLDSFRTQAVATRIHAFIMSLVDGRRSLEDIAAVLVEHRLMTRDEAVPAIRSFLIKMHEDSRRPELG